MTVSGVNRPASIPIVTVIIFITDPGSQGICTAILVWRAAASSGVGVSRRGSNVGRLASARISPLRGSMTTTVPLSAPDSRMPSARKRSASYWMTRSIDSVTFRPGTAGRIMSLE